MPEVLQTIGRQRFETEWESLRLVVEERLDHWQGFVYDVENCEVLQMMEHPTADEAKIAALEFAAIHAFGPKHGLKLHIIAAMLCWETAL